MTGCLSGRHSRLSNWEALQAVLRAGEGRITATRTAAKLVSAFSELRQLDAIFALLSAALTENLGAAGLEIINDAAFKAAIDRVFLLLSYLKLFWWV